MDTASDRSVPYKRGGRQHVGVNVSILPQPPLHSLTRSEGREIWSQGRHPWCLTAPMAAFAKVVPRECRWRPEGLRTFTWPRHSPTPPASAMADDLALGHGKKSCSSSRLGPYTWLGLTFGIKNNIRLDLGRIKCLELSLFGVWLSSKCHVLKQIMFG
jgi:hypothetical protein